MAAMEEINKKALTINPNKKVMKIKLPDLPAGANWTFTPKEVGGIDRMISLMKGDKNKKSQIKVILVVDIMEENVAPQAAFTNKGAVKELDDADIDYSC